MLAMKSGTFQKRGVTNYCIICSFLILLIFVEKLNNCTLSLPLFPSPPPLSIFLFPSPSPFPFSPHPPPHLSLTLPPPSPSPSPLSPYPPLSLSLVDSQYLRTLHPLYAPHIVELTSKPEGYCYVIENVVRTDSFSACLQTE